MRLAICLNLLDLSHDARQSLVNALDRASDTNAIPTRRWVRWLDSLVAAADNARPLDARPLVDAVLETEF